MSLRRKRRPCRRPTPGSGISRPPRHPGARPALPSSAARRPARGGLRAGAGGVAAGGDRALEHVVDALLRQRPQSPRLVRQLRRLEPRVPRLLPQQGLLVLCLQTPPRRVGVVWRRWCAAGAVAVAARRCE